MTLLTKDPEVVGPWDEFKALVGVKPEETRGGVASLKSYLLQFGYIAKQDGPAPGCNFTDKFDNVSQGCRQDVSE